MKFSALTLQGFRSFKAQQTISFSGMRPGLYHVTGKNLVAPELEANGCGKSSLFDGLYWVLYGKTPRNLRGPSLINWKSKSCVGVVEMQDLGVYRQLKPNTLEVFQDDGEMSPVDQQTLEERLVLSSDAFLYSVYFAQFNPQLVDLRTTEQTEMFSNVLRLDRWEEASSNASQLAAETGKTLAEQREELARVSGQLEEVQNNVADLKWEKEWDQQNKKDRLELKASLDKLEKQAKGAEHKLNKMWALRDKADTYLATMKELQRDASRVQEKIKTFKEDLKSTKDKVCSECGQPVSSKQHRAQVSTSLVKAQKEYDHIITAVNKLGEPPHFDDSGFNLLEDYDALEKTVNDNRVALALAQRELRGLEGATNPHRVRRERDEARSKDLAKQVKQLSSQIEETQSEFAAAQLWSKAFKEIRLQLIEESLQQLSAETNQCLFALGLRDWEIKFAVESVTKKGTINSGFSITVRAPGVDGAVPWEVWCGGESQRLRLAVCMGFSNLICSRLGIQPNVEFWDEPSQWLSTSGIQDLLQVLQDRAEAQQKVILIADHRTLDYGGFAGIITLVHDHNGSRLE